ncbi:MFS transporter [Streptacidiphilus sp. P02-A3a]|uniref:MFS transporter n=1 Tax=Streptacidiphilus sp. P02-A3a TaxID=2704468 RepID=UPI0015F9C6DC|nr:MFS transporter [Streptacidiphilus sp. P02-A3a]QMU71461.1 MFS transporter [Streptacidiphilus sp. P02-A3a]
MSDRVAEPQAPAADALPPLNRNRDFLLLWSGQAISSFGNELSAITYPLLVLAVTGSAARAGLVGSAELVAMLALLLPAGAVADRWSRRAVMVVSSLVQLAALGGVSAAIGLGWVPLGLLVAAGALEGAGSAFYIGASRGAVRRVVPAPQLSRALARTQARDQAAAIGGPPSGGALFAVARFLPFGLDSVSFAVAALAAALVRGTLDPPRSPGGPGNPAAAGPGVGAGLRLVLGHRYLRVVALWAAAVNAVATGMMLLVIVLARSRGAEPSQIGVITATFSAGGLLGALSAPRLIGRYSGRTLVLIASWLLVPCPVAMVLAPSPLLIGVAGAVSVCAIAPVNVILLTRAYELIPHEMQGRAGNAMLLCANSLKWLTPVVFGAMADRWGPVPPIMVGAALYGITAVWLQGKGVLRQLDAPAVPAVGVPV